MQAYYNLKQECINNIIEHLEEVSWGGAADRVNHASSETLEMVAQRIKDIFESEDYVTDTQINDFVWFECNDLFVEEEEQDTEDDAMTIAYQAINDLFDDYPFTPIEIELEAVGPECKLMFAKLQIQKKVFEEEGVTIEFEYLHGERKLVARYETIYMDEFMKRATDILEGQE